MSTRAIYSFIDGTDAYHVYKHHDGYPSWAWKFIAAAAKAAWPMPRFEADEFAASFVAANKSECGGVRLLHSGHWQDIAPADIEYRYEILCIGGKLHVKAYDVSCDYASWTWTETLLCEGTPKAIGVWAEKERLARCAA